MTSILSNLLLFGRVLRRLGFDVPVGSLIDLTEALTHVDLGARDEVFYTCRAVLVRSHDQLAAFESAFDAFWRDRRNPFAPEDGRAGERLPASAPAAAARGAPPIGELVTLGDRDGACPPGGSIRTWSDVSSFARKDFAEFSADEIALARAALARLAWIPGTRRTRRWVRGRGPRIDVRRALAGSLRTGGEILALPRRRRRVRPRSLVLLCDVSGSMERCSRMLVQFAHGVGQQDARVETFFFATGLTRVTKPLRARRLDAAASAVSAAVPDWSGGTRIGFALRQFNRQWSRRVLRSGPVVLLVSDGWDCGDPAVLRDEVARLQRSCHRLIWLNPLIGTGDYAPLTRGLQAALPFVDDFLPARTLADLGDLALHLAAIAPTGRRLRHRL